MEIINKLSSKQIDKTEKLNNVVHALSFQNKKHSCLLF
jgi:hypothetical protein